MFKVLPFLTLHVSLNCKSLIILVSSCWCSSSMMKRHFFFSRKSKLNFIYLQKSTYFNFLLNFWLIALNFVFTGAKLLENFGQRICPFWNRFEKLEDSIWSRCSVSDIFENIPRDVYSCVSICFCWGHRSIIVWTNWFWC